MIDRKNIVGHGDIASVLPEQDRLLFFASGVSNSQETRESEYQREVDLLRQQDRRRHLVYFSSLAVFYGDSRYVEHKKLMESLVKKRFEGHTIVRVGNIAWGTNPHTLINYLKHKIRTGQPYEVQDAYRYVVRKEEFLHWIDLIPDWSCEINIPGQKLKVADIVKRIQDGFL